jgi:tetratricopeptide (TPR) repeat protein
MMLYAIVLAAAPLSVSAQDDEADDALQRELDSILAATTPDSPDSVKAYNYYLISAKTEYVDTSLKYSTRSLMFCKDEDTILRAKNYSNIAWAHLYNGDYSTAYKHLSKGISLFRQSRDSVHLPTAYLMMARICDNQNFADSALQYLNSALDICIRIHDTTLMTVATPHWATFLTTSTSTNRQKNTTARRCKSTKSAATSREWQLQYNGLATYTRHTKIRSKTASTSA